MPKLPAGEGKGPQPYGQSLRWSTSDTFYHQTCCEPEWCELFIPGSNGIKFTLATYAFILNYQYLFI